MTEKQTLIDALLMAHPVHPAECQCRFHKLAIELEAGEKILIPSKNLRMLDSMMRAIVASKRKDYDDTTRNGGPGNAS